MPLYAGKYAICAFLQNMRNMLRSHDRYKPVSLTILLLLCSFAESISDAGYCVVLDVCLSVTLEHSATVVGTNETQFDMGICVAQSNTLLSRGSWSLMERTDLEFPK